MKVQEAYETNIGYVTSMKRERGAAEGNSGSHHDSTAGASHIHPKSGATPEGVVPARRSQSTPNFDIVFELYVETFASGTTELTSSGSDFTACRPCGTPGNSPQ